MTRRRIPYKSQNNKLLISFTPTAPPTLSGSIINPPALPESSGWHKKNSHACKFSPFYLLSPSSSPVSCSSLRSAGFQCDGLSCEGPEWLWQTGIAAVPRCLGGLTLFFQDDWGCLLAPIPGFHRVLSPYLGISGHYGLFTAWHKGNETPRMILKCVYIKNVSDYLQLQSSSIRLCNFCSQRMGCL